MRIVLFCHSLVSCWNHGNAHFLRGIVRELGRRGHEIRVLEPEAGWSRRSLQADHGAHALDAWRRVYPDCPSETYRDLNGLDRVLDGAELVLVHEWTPPELVAALSRRKARGARFTLLFHDTHHRLVSDPAAIDRLDLGGFDGILAFGAVLARLYEDRGWRGRVWVWHEAADTNVFRPIAAEKSGDLVWIGNWGDDERNEELHEFLVRPCAELGLRTLVHGVRYPEPVRDLLARRAIDYGGWLPNHRVPELFARHRVTVHVPRRPYARMLPGIPTIRVFEALACGIPLVCAPWADEEALFPPGSFLRAADGSAMRRHLHDMLHDEALRRALVETGLRAIRDRHTCAHRVDELFAIVDQLRAPAPSERAPSMELAPCA